MSKKPAKPPVWWKNTFFIFGFALLVLAVWGLVKGEAVIRDPGQKFETGLVMFYLIGGVVMLGNGWMTHQQSMQQFSELSDDEVPASVQEPTSGVEEEAND
ncbi:MAG: hypothetical protein KF836_00975 [Fimbriimonadaceae bacterium]|nr:hypothetical protein [Fimbriimonadaceae bacterium]